MCIRDRDRINSMNAMFCNAKGERRYRVNPDRCPTYADALEQQGWGTNGEPCLLYTSRCV